MADRPNVLLLVFDSVRPDDLSPYGGPVETDAIASVERRGTTFEQAFAAGPGTPMSHGAIFSGQYPSETGVVGPRPMPDNVPMLATQFRQAGYRTVGIPGPAKSGASLGFDRGFETFVEAYTDDIPTYNSVSYLSEALTNSRRRMALAKDFMRVLHRGTDDHTAIKFDLLERAIADAGDEPVFAFMNTTVAHIPYDPPRPYKERAIPSLDRPQWFLLEYLFGTEEKLHREDVRDEQVYHAQTADGIARYLADPSYLSDAEMGILRAWYRAAIAYLDSRLGKFLDWLERNDELEETIIVCTADHGEHFGEHGMFTHSHYLYEQSLHVPLILAGPGVPEAERRADLVSLVDLFDTLCSLGGVPRPERTSGHSMFDGPERDHVCAEYGVMYNEKTSHAKYMSDDQFESFRAGRKGIITDDHRYVVASNSEETLYDRDTDTEVGEPNPEVVDRLGALLFSEVGREFLPAGDQLDVSNDIEENLRKLGYID